MQRPRFRLRRPRLTYANVASTLALVLAMSTGGAYAHGMIGSAQIKQNAVKSRHIAGQNVKTPDIKNNAVTRRKLANGSVNSAKVSDRSLKGTDLAVRADGVAMAGVTIIGTTLRHSFNRAGGAITFTNPSAGTYRITIPGASFNTWQHVVYSATGGFQRYCYANSTPATNTIEVVCENFAGTPLNAQLNFVLFKDAVGSVARPPAPRTRANR
jgi:hypothetical protein